MSISFWQELYRYKKRTAAEAKHHYHKHKKIYQTEKKQLSHLEKYAQEYISRHHTQFSHSDTEQVYQNRSCFLKKIISSIQEQENKISHLKKRIEEKEAEWKAEDTQKRVCEKIYDKKQLEIQKIRRKREEKIAAEQEQVRYMSKM